MVRCREQVILGMSRTGDKSCWEIGHAGDESCWEIGHAGDESCWEFSHAGRCHAGDEITRSSGALCRSESQIK